MSTRHRILLAVVAVVWLAATIWLQWYAGQTWAGWEPAG